MKPVKLSKGRTTQRFTQHIEGKGNRRRVVLRVGSGHSPAFYKKHPKGSIYSAVSLRATTQKAAIRRVRKRGREKLSGESYAPSEKKFSRSEDRVIPYKNVDQMTTERLLQRPGSLGGMFKITYESMVRKKTVVKTAMIEAFSRSTKQPLSKLTAKGRERLLGEAEKAALAQFFPAVMAESSDIISVEFEPPILYRYWIDK